MNGRRGHAFVVLVAVILLLISTVVQAGEDKRPWNYKQRPPILVSKTADGIYTISNFRWGFDEKVDSQGRKLPKWRTVTIDTNKCTKAYLAVKVFPPEWIAGHGLSLFRFEPDSPVRTEYGETSKGLIVSVEAYLREGQKYSIFEGMKRVWPTIWVLSSFEDYRQASSLDNLKLIFYELDLTPEQARDMLRRSLDKACQDHTKDMYHTVEASCMTAQIDILNEVVEPSRRIPRFFFGKIVNPYASLPRVIGRSLKKKRLLKNELPVFMPMPEHTADRTTKEYAGPARQEALRRYEALLPAVARAENVLRQAILEGHIKSPEMLRLLLYNDVADQVLYLNVPGVVPGEANNGEFIIGSEFDSSLRQCLSAAQLEKLVASSFEAYRAALKKRMLLEGPDISPYVNRAMAALVKSVTEFVKTVELNSR